MAGGRSQVYASIAQRGLQMVLCPAGTGQPHMQAFNDNPQSCIIYSFQASSPRGFGAWARSNLGGWLTRRFECHLSSTAFGLTSLPPKMLGPTRCGEASTSGRQPVGSYSLRSSCHNPRQRRALVLARQAKLAGGLVAGHFGTSQMD
jgi:hypothetical protein